MLNGTRDTNGEVQLWRNDLARLSDLQFVRGIARIYCSTRSAHGCAHLISQTEDQAELFLAAQRAATRHDLGGALQVWTVALRRLYPNEASVRGQGGRGGHGFDGSAAASGSGFERSRTHGDHDLLVGRRLDRDDGIAGVDGTLEGVRAFDGHQVRDLADAQQRSDTRHEVLAEAARRAEHVGVTRRNLHHLRRQHGSHQVSVLGAVGHQHLGHAGEFRCCRRDGSAICCQHQDMNFGARHGRGGLHRACRTCIQLAAVMVGNHQNLAGHQTSPFFFSASTSSATSLTTMPLLRVAGAA